MTSPSSRIAHSTGVLAAATGVSRILGFVRDVLLAALFGTSAQAEAFVVAFRLPNLFRDLVAEGAVTSAFVPVLTWYRTKGIEEFWRLSQVLLVRLVIALCLLGLVGAWAAPLIVRVVAPGFADDPDRLALTVRLTRLLFPFVTLVGLWAYFMGLLNSLGHFAVPALGPAILNVAMIAACLWFVPRTEPGILAVAVAVMIGGVLQLLIQLPVAARLGLRWAWRWRHPGSAQIMRLFTPRVLGAGVYQANVVIHTALASVVGAGAVAALYFANRLVQLPLALFGTASAQASLPALAEQAAHGQTNEFRATLLSVMRMVSFVILPSAVGLIVLAVPIVDILFERGAFDHQATVMTSQALVCYSLGLLAYALSKVLSGAFYALHDTRTPVALALEAMVVNVLLSLALMGRLQVSGLALAAAVANTLNAYRLIRRLERRLGTALVAPLGRSLLRMLAASGLMGASCGALWYWWVARWHTGIGLLIVICCGVGLYAAACALVRVGEFQTVLRWLKSLPLVQFFDSE